VIIVCDTSPIVALVVCGKLDLLDRLFSEVYIPKSVYDELTVSDKPGAAEISEWAIGKVRSVQDTQLDRVLSLGLDLGEAEALALYWKKAADYLLIDEKRGRTIAVLNGVNAIGTLGILLLAKSKGLLPLIKPSLDLLKKSSIRISSNLYERVLVAAGEDE
jgi:predicted nucleic acid-binding protein